MAKHYPTATEHAADRSAGVVPAEAVPALAAPSSSATPPRRKGLLRRTISAVCKTLLALPRLYWLLAYVGTARVCPICERRCRLFMPAGIIRRSDACCPHCSSLERHRSMWLYLIRHSQLLQRRVRMLHIAPEECVAARLREHVNVDYVSADLSSPLAMVHMDITTMPYLDGCFDLLYCSHVLEHIPDDRAAMQEIIRVLRPGGVAMVQVPIASAETTYEDWTIHTPERRLVAFGQSDHVRVYGRDFIHRLANAGFTVQPIDIRSLLELSETERCGVGTDETIFVCQKQTVGQSALSNRHHV